MAQKFNWTVPSGTFVYAPDIAVYVDTRSAGVIDLSKDVVSFNLSRMVKAQSTFSCVLNNKFKKHDGVIDRMSRIVVFLKRINWVQVFSGYVTTTPYESITPGNCTIDAACTLKRLEHIYWDPLLYANTIYPALDVTALDSPDGGAAVAAFKLLTLIAKWPPEQILIEKIPASFLAMAASLQKKGKNTVDQKIVDLWENLLTGLGIVGSQEDVGTASPGNNPALGEPVVGGGQPVQGGVPPSTAPALPGSPKPRTITFWNQAWQRFPNQIRIGSVCRPTDSVTGSYISQHVFCNAIDVSPNSLYTTELGQQQLTNLWLWTLENRYTLNVGNVIFYRYKWSTGGGFGPYTGSDGSDSGDHINHVHIDFLPTHGANGPYAPFSATGANAGPLPVGAPGYGQGMGDPVMGPGGAMGGGAIPVGGGGNPFVLLYNYPQMSLDTESYTGVRSWLNDKPALQAVRYFMEASLRDFQSAPNGDFVGWFPDKFGFYGKTPAMLIRDIEVADFRLTLSDNALTTHVGIAGDVVLNDGTTDLTIADGVNMVDWMNTQGLITVQDEEIMKLVMRSEDVWKGEDLLQRFGLRPLREEIPEIRLFAWENLYAINKFMEKWSEQFVSTVQFTFMPELYPGMRVELADHGIGFYVEQVTHSGSRTGGFSTIVQASCPTKMTPNGPQMLPIEKPPTSLPGGEDIDSHNLPIGPL